jgi:D-sedoheptulose 7-phosphate isomerase
MDGTLIQIIHDEVDKTRSVLERILTNHSLLGAIADASQRCIDTLRSGNKILFAGNGGSAADAQHLAGELVSRFKFDRPALPGIALTTDTSILTAIGNDYGYDHVFARQVAAIGLRGDVFIGISTSGRSRNVLAALKQCRELGITSIGFTGDTGGDMLGRCDVCLRMPSSETPKIQEGHIVIGHILCQIIESSLFSPRQ